MDIITSIFAVFGPILLLILIAGVLIKSYKYIHHKEIISAENISSIPTSIYRKWYALIIPASGVLGGVLFNFLSLSDPQRNFLGDKEYSSFSTICIFACIGFYITVVSVTGTLFVLRLYIYSKRNDALLLLFFSVFIGIVLFPVYYVYNLICICTKKRTLNI